MPRKLTSAKARMWAGYNRRRAKNRAADSERRRANAAAKLAAAVEARSFRPKRSLRLTGQPIDSSDMMDEIEHLLSLPQNTKVTNSGAEKL